MKRLSKKTRFILSIIILLLCILLSWLLVDILGDLSMFIAFIGGAAFFLLNPELMKGE